MVALYLSWFPGFYHSLIVIHSLANSFIHLLTLLGLYKFKCKAMGISGISRFNIQQHGSGWILLKMFHVLVSALIRNGEYLALF